MNMKIFAVVLVVTCFTVSITGAYPAIHYFPPTPTTNRNPHTPTHTNQPHPHTKQSNL
ncbi:MAG: hypothetical protein FWE73_08370 [Candidatus Bathyarchaeota archaeon]|nr:hypothetical protein [Candidatus Termitimicrobium sp.]